MQTRRPHVNLLALFALGGLIAMGRPVSAQDAPKAAAKIAPIDYTQETLDNGLKVLYVPLKSAPVVHVRVMYHVGSKDERPDRQGFAHMFEHMMFRGSAHVKPEEHMKLVNGVGGITNAFTSFDQTTYVNTVPSEHTEMALWLEADRMASFKVSDEIYRTERKVVAEEWGMRMNQPYGNLFEEYLKRAFTKHSYRWTPIGVMEHLRAAPASELQEFFNTYYIPNNALLVIAGDIDVNQAKGWVKKYYGWIPKGPEIKRLAQPEPEHTAATRDVVPAPVPLPAVLMSVQAPRLSSDDGYALALASEILGGGPSSRLYKRLVATANPICTNVNSIFYPLEDGGIFGAMGIAMMGKSADEIEKAMREELLNLAQNGVTAEELDKAKANFRKSVVDQRKTAEQVARNMGEEWLFGGDAARANTELDKVLALDVAAVKSILAKYVKANALTVMQMVPDMTGMSRKPVVPVSATAPVAPSTVVVAPRVTEFPAQFPAQAPMAEPRTTAKFNQGKEITVGGAKVIVMSDHRLPVATLMVALRRGSHSEPVGKEGLADLTAGMLRRGAGGMTFGELNQRLDARAISLGVGDHGDYTQLVASCPAEQLGEAARLGRLVLREPNFDEKEFENLKAQSISALARSLVSPTAVAEHELQALLYGNSPLGRHETPQSMSAITLADVKDFYGKIYRPKDAVILLAGDVTEAQGKELAEQILKGWEGDLAPAPTYDLGAGATKRRIVLIDNPDGKQATVRLGIRAYDTQNPDRFAGSLANQILSGGIEARVMRYVRAEKGLAYHATGIFSAGRQAGAFMGQTDTKTESAADAVEAMFKVFEDMRSAPVPQAELKDSRLRVAGLLVMGMQTIEQQADRRLTTIFNNFPADYWDTYVGHLAAVTPEKILEVMKKYVETGRMSIVVVAPAAQARGKLSRLGEVEVKPMPAAK